MPEMHKAPLTRRRMDRMAGVPIGTVHQWMEGWMRKVGPRKWVPAASPSDRHPVSQERTGAIAVSERQVRSIVSELSIKQKDGKVAAISERPSRGARTIWVKTPHGKSIPVDYSFRLVDNEVRVGNGVSGSLATSLYNTRRLVIELDMSRVIGKPLGELVQDVRSTIAHELTHAADPEVGLIPVRALSGKRKAPQAPHEDFESYVNDQTEVTARIGEIVRDLLDRKAYALMRRRAAHSRKSGEPLGGLNAAFIAKNLKWWSPTWRRYEPFFNPQSRKRILRAVAATISGIQEGRLKPITKSIPPVLRRILKAKIPIGAVHRWKDGVLMRKVSAGKWVPATAPEHRPKGGEVKLTKKGLDNLLKHGDFSIVSAGKNMQDPREKRLPDKHEKFLKRHEELRKDLIDQGFTFTEVEGKYDNDELSFVVYHDKPAGVDSGSKAMLVQHVRADAGEYRVIRDLGRKYNQDSVIHSKAGVNEMHYTTGSNAGKHCKGKGFEYKPLADNYFTKMRTPKTVTKFALGFDFDHRFGMDKALHKARYRPRSVQ